MIDPAEIPVPASSDDDIDVIGREALFSVGGPGAAKFRLGPDAPVCDIVMKGGVTSGVVYPYAVMRLAQKFRLAGIGGTSAGAIAAALTAAAEYARLGNGDSDGFSRFERWCIQLPTVLKSLFQPHPKHRAIFGFATIMMEVLDSAPSLGQRLRALARLLHTRAGLILLPVIAGAVGGALLGSARYIWFYGLGHGLVLYTGMLNPGLAAALVAAGVGLLSGLLLAGLFALALRIQERWPMWLYLLLLAGAAAVSIGGELGSLLAVVVTGALGGAAGLVAAGVFLGDRVIDDLRNSDFGMCPGTTQRRGGPKALTDWLHEAIQDVAGRDPDGPPLTFGEVEAAAPADQPRLALRMITTNLTLRRPYAIPDLGGRDGRIGWSPEDWEHLFPESVIAHLIACGDPDLAWNTVRPLPRGADLPVLVGARMSLSFPLLFSAVPVHELAKNGKPQGRMLLIDGGLSSNLPLHFFDSLGPPAYPTFAFNLEDDPNLRPRRPGDALKEFLDASELRLHRETKRKADLDKLAKRRISLHGPGKWQPRLKRMPHRFFRQYLDSLLGAAKDWQDNLQSIMPGQFDRIVTIKLGPGEGGLNLVMPKARSELLMQLGYLAGKEVAEKFDLQAHRVRRALTAYQEIERVAGHFARNWTSADLAAALAQAKPPRDSRPAWTRDSRKVIIRLARLAKWSGRMKPLPDTARFPGPRGALRITPNLSGDS
jgi:predicted acylesterase/phospholipase RssA